MSQQLSECRDGSVILEKFLLLLRCLVTAQKMKFSIKNFFSKYVFFFFQRIWSHLTKKSLTLFRMGFFGAAHGWGGGGSHTYPTIMKLGTVIPYPKI